MARTMVTLGVLLGLILFTRTAAATTIEFEVPPAVIGPGFNGAQLDLHSPSLNGVPFQGQSLSLDLVLANGVLERTWFISASPFTILGIIFFSPVTVPAPVNQPATSFILDPQGKQFGSSLVCCLAFADRIGFGVTVFANDVLDVGGAHIFDLKGLHSDITLPNAPGLVVTDLTLRFATGYNTVVRFGTAEQLGPIPPLPEPGTFALVLTGVLLSLLAAHRVRSHSTN